jgi:hypothetical protein
MPQVSGPDIAKAAPFETIDRGVLRKRHRLRRASGSLDGQPVAVKLFGRAGDSHAVARVRYLSGSGKMASINPVAASGRVGFLRMERLPSVRGYAAFRRRSPE